MKSVLSNFLHRVIMQILWFMIRLLMSTFRYEYIGKEKIEAASSKGTFLFAIWHEHMVAFLSAHAWTHPYMTMASRSKDGDYASFVSSRMGFTPIRGSARKKKTSKDKGGKEAIDQYIHNLAHGLSGGITVDGPKGPRHECKFGIAKIAAESGRPIVPGVAIAYPCWTLNSWDKFKLPKPFAKITIKYGDPIEVNKDATPDDLVEVCRSVEKSLIELES